MSKKLAIKGHSTRGKEVIELLEMMGGVNSKNFSGKCDFFYFFIDNDNIIWSDSNFNNNFAYFTLEEFLEKFPFKIHDLVNIPEYESTVGICGMRWDPYSKYVEYMVYRCDDEEWYTAEELLEWNDNPNNTSKNMEEKKINQMSLANCDLDEIEIFLGDKFEMKIKGGKYYAVRKKPKYPTTYEECCEKINACPIVSISYDSDEDMLYNDKFDLTLLTLRKLIICRDAYWKIAGEKMGLGKPWEPNWSGVKLETKYVIYNQPNAGWVITTSTLYKCILTFPTPEMRDAFYENFKDLIEQCKELL